MIAAVPETLTVQIGECVGRSLLAASSFFSLTIYGVFALNGNLSSRLPESPGRGSLILAQARDAAPRDLARPGQPWPSLGRPAPGRHPAGRVRPVLGRLGRVRVAVSRPGVAASESRHHGAPAVATADESATARGASARKSGRNGSARVQGDLHGACRGLGGAGGRRGRCAAV
jgi:hypothetical protein